MRFIFKTNYDQDIALAKHSGHYFWYGLLAVFLMCAPWLLSEYWLAQVTFTLIYSIVAVGLMLLAGFTGLFSIGHAAFMGVGAYTEAYLTAMGWPFPLTLMCAMGLSAAVGVVVGLPSLRVKGMYLAIATLAFAMIVEEVFARWESVTGGNAGKFVGSPRWFSWELNQSNHLYWLCLACTVLATLAVLNLLRSPTGRALVAIRDSEVSAQSMGIHLARYKSISFATSAALAGLGGALYAHQIQYLTPEQFGLLQSIDLMLMVVVGGLGFLHGAFLGAAVLIGLPQMIAMLKDILPPAVGQAIGLQNIVYGLVLIGFVLYEPAGLYGRWLKIRSWLQLYPFYRTGMNKRQRSFQKSERVR